MPTARSSRPGLAWTRVRDSLWLLPALAVVVGAGLAVLAVDLPTPRAESRFSATWLFGGSSEGARGVLSAIAGSLITVTGVVFSVTIVALQLASSQFTPRLLRSFVADRVNQTVLAVFIGTFTYTLLVLRTIRSDGDGAAAVPQVAVTLALVLLLVSVGALIVYIDHAAQSIRAPVILHRESRRTLAQIAALFPEDVGRPVDERDGADGTPPEGDGVVVPAAESGYLQAVHASALWALGDAAADAPVTIRMELHVGAFAFPGRPLATAWPATIDQRALDAAVREAFILGPERTPEQDVEFGLVELSDIAVKALSPGINDPTTAMHCIDRLAELLAALGTRGRPALLRASPDGRVRLRVRDTPFDRAAGLAFDGIRHFGASNPAIAKKLLAVIGELVAVVRPAARPALFALAESVLRAARRTIDDPHDLAAIQRLADAVTGLGGEVRVRPSAAPA